MQSLLKGFQRGKMEVVLLTACSDLARQFGFFPKDQELRGTFFLSNPFRWQKSLPLSINCNAEVLLAKDLPPFLLRVHLDICPLL